jgi:hypothetical protein
MSELSPAGIESGSIGETTTGRARLENQTVHLLQLLYLAGTVTRNFRGNIEVWIIHPQRAQRTLLTHQPNCRAGYTETRFDLGAEGHQVAVNGEYICDPRNPAVTAIIPHRFSQQAAADGNQRALFLFRRGGFARHKL